MRLNLVLSPLFSFCFVQSILEYLFFLSSPSRPFLVSLSPLHKTHRHTLGPTWLVQDRRDDGRKPKSEAAEHELWSIASITENIEGKKEKSKEAHPGPRSQPPLLSPSPALLPPTTPSSHTALPLDRIWRQLSSWTQTLSSEERPSYSVLRTSFSFPLSREALFVRHLFFVFVTTISWDSRDFLGYDK